jgi:hypothetical protein
MAWSDPWPCAPTRGSDPAGHIFHHT